MAEGKKGPGRPKGSTNKTTSEKKGTKSGSNSRAKVKAQEIQAKRKADKRVIDEIWAIITIAVGAFLVVATFTSGAGKLGEIIDATLKGLFGFMSYIVPFLLIIFGVLLFARKTSHFTVKTVLLFAVIVLMVCTTYSIHYIIASEVEWTLDSVKAFYFSGQELESGGFFGMVLASLLVVWLGSMGTYIFTIVVTIICLTLIINTPVSRFFQKIGDKIEERKLIRENSHLDDYEEEVQEEIKIEQQAKAKESKAKAQEVKVEKTENSWPRAAMGLKPKEKKDVKIVSSSIFDDKDQKMPEPKETEVLVQPEYTPLSEKLVAEQTTKVEKNNKQVLSYVNDTNLFGETPKAEAEVTTGLEPKREVQKGYGIDGAGKTISQGLGLTGTVIKEEEPVSNSFEPYTEIPMGNIAADAACLTAAAGVAAAKTANAVDVDKYANVAMAGTAAGLGGLAGTKKDYSSMVKTSADAPPTNSYRPGTNDMKTASQTSPMAGTADKEVVAKLSQKEAANAMLTTEEINREKVEYVYPPIELLDRPANNGRTNTSALHEKAIKLEETLKSFNVDADVVQVTQGPTVTRYEVQPAVGVKVSKIVSLADDIALNLRAKSIIIEAPIPGKAAVGIEIENESSTMVKIREIIDSEEFKKAKSRITVALGKDINGTPIVADLKAMPHLLIAGSTGSGKSVCINSIITSLMFKAKPDEVKMILIDPKVVELGNYNGIPHLLIPVVTDPSKAAAALNWAVSEMTDRYKKFAEEGVRDIASYNEYVVANGEADKKMPQVVIIIDELADLMMAAPSQIQDSICRLAQMARAAGMHLIVATQRPSVDVITGVIKANIPSRIAFAVSSHVDSQTILDMKGAEKLVGKGDMLYYPMGMGKPIRVQGTFISDAEVNGIIDFVKGQCLSTNLTEADILAKIERSTSTESSDDSDELLNDAVDLIVGSGQASVSMLQRRFRIGYNRAARIMDIMEAKGYVGPQDGARPRQVLLNEEEWENIKNGGNTEE